MQADDLLGTPLRQVSRSFYLTLKVLHRAVRRPIGLAYLLARAADTIADSPLIPRADHLAYLDLFRESIKDGHARRLSAIRAAVSAQYGNAAERQLLARLDDCFVLLRGLDPADQSRVRGVILTLTEGMALDLATFPGEDENRLVALETRADLDRYTYLVAGCVGEFWTDLHMAHRPSLAGWEREAMKARGVRFGKGLQMTNILRDLAKDLRIGRCYLPRQDLEALGLEPRDLLDPTASVKIAPLLRDLLALTLDHYREGWAYTLAIPRREVRMRLACVWPLFIGLKTLAMLGRAPNLLAPDRTIKIRRSAVYALMARSFLAIGSNAALDRQYRAIRREIMRVEQE